MTTARLALLVVCSCGTNTALRIPAQLFAQVDPSQVASYELWVLNQIGRDNNPIKCADLLSRALAPASNEVLKIIEPIDGTFGSSTISVKGVDDGQQDRIFYIDLYNQPGQLGERIGAGCAASVSIVGGKTTSVDITIEPPP